MGVAQRSALRHHPGASGATAAHRSAGRCLCPRPLLPGYKLTLPLKSSAETVARASGRWSDAWRTTRAANCRPLASHPESRRSLGEGPGAASYRPETRFHTRRAGPVALTMRATIPHTNQGCFPGRASTTGATRAASSDLRSSPGTVCAGLDWCLHCSHARHPPARPP